MRFIQNLVITSAATVSVALASCGGIGFDPAEQVKTLRVLAVQKLPPYQAAGSDVTLRMLFWDAKAPAGAPRPLQIVFSDCVNPPADLYYRCFDANAQLFPPESQTSTPPSPDADHVAVHTFKLPADIVTSRPAPQAGTPAYGLAYVLFAVCAGKLGVVPQSGETSLPLGCFASDGTALGVDDFVPGYSSIYSYADARTNNNPVVHSFALSQGGTAVTADANGALHVPHCAPGACADWEFKVDVDRASAEPDPGATDLDGQPVSEQLWISYDTTGGNLDKAQRLVNDATRGWNDDNATHWTPPVTPGMVRLWGIVHDNRGGVEWAEATISVD